MIYEIPTLSSVDERIIEEIIQLRQRMRDYLRAPRRWTGTLRRNVLARTVRGSTRIEGYHTTLEEATALLEGGEVDVVAETRQAVTGYRDALTFVLQVADRWPPIDAVTLRALHYMMMHHDQAAGPGNWRPGPIRVADSQGVSVYTGPDRDQLEELIDALIHQLSTQETPLLVKAAMAHLNLTLIHPFTDGNGRMARCLQTFVLAAAGIREPVFASIEEYLGRRTADYYQALTEVAQGEWSPHRDAHSWIKFCLTAHYHQARTHLRRLEESRLLWEECELLSERAGLPKRVVGALYDASRGRPLSRSTYQRITELATGETPSDAVASRDLAALVKAGLLLQEGEGRRRHYRATRQLQDTWGAIRLRRKPFDYRNPYEIFDQSELPWSG